MQRVRERARREKKTLKDTLSEVIAMGLVRAEKQKNIVLAPGTLDLGQELKAVDSRTQLYEAWDKEP